MNSSPIDTNMPPMDKEQADAERRFKEYESVDPFPKVPPALLNSGDLCDYVRKTGMICPFPSKEELRGKLKSASYEVDFLGTVYFINEQGQSKTLEISKYTPFRLKKNAIVYVFLKTTFRLPDYIALRFNLRIKHVHRGLLLGTGPLVDPGFCGNLLVPIHNLTSRDYVLIGGEGLIWVEFTKLSPHRRWSGSAREDSYDYVPFPPGNRYSSAHEYLIKATGDGRPAESSIPGEILEVKAAAENARVGAETAKEEAASARKLLTYVSGATVAAIAALVLGSWQVALSATQSITGANKIISDYQAEKEQMEKKLSEAQRLIEKLTMEVKALQASQSNQDKGG